MPDQKHPVAQVIEELGETVGMAVADPVANVHYRPSYDDLDASEFGKTRISVGSVTEFKLPANGAAGQGTPVTTHTITVVGASDGIDGTPGLKAPHFARLVCKMIEEVTGEHIGREVLNKQGDRKFTFKHDDVIRGRSDVEKHFAAMKEKLLAAGNEQYLDDFKSLLKLAQKIETEFSDNPAQALSPTVATRIVPSFRIGDQGVPILGMEIQTNHSRLKNQFTGKQNQGINNTEIMGNFFGVIAGDSHTRAYAGGRFIKAEGPSAMTALKETVEALFVERPREAPKQPDRESSAGFGFTRI